ncbi:MAG: transcription-repair coupling factor [Clostridia bacterium]|nr:transcription-repair coupling factor [Clostridia bacterium]
MFNFYEVLKNNQLTTYKKNLNKGIRQALNGCPVEVKGLLTFFSGQGSIFVFNDLVSAGKIAEQASALGAKCEFILSNYEDSMGLIDHVTKCEFISNLYKFVAGEVNVLLISVEALFQKAPTKQSLLENVLKLKQGGFYNFKNLVSDLIETGYNRVEFASGQGQFSLRGDILEIFAINQKNLIRVEFFDDQIERMSLVTLEDKIFVGELNQANIVSINQPQSNVNLLSLADIVFFDEPKKLQETALYFIQSHNLINEEKNESVNSTLQINFENLEFKQKTNYVEPNLIFKTKAKNEVAFINFKGKNFFNFEVEVDIKTLGTKNYVFDTKELFKDIKFLTESGLDVYLFCGSIERKTSLDKLLTENFIFTSENEGKAEQAKNLTPLTTEKNIIGFTGDIIGLSNYNFETNKGNVYLVDSLLPYSISFADSNAVLIGTYSLFKKQKQEVQSKKRLNFYAPKVGEYVVHSTHGVGRCIGAKRLKLTEFEKDYFIIEYAFADKLYLPSEQADMISAFYGNDEPQLNKLGSSDFERVKKQVYKNVKKLAINLLELYSKRENSKGFIYNKDDYLMELFENAFEFEETEDQLRAIVDVKKDMESSKVMDRLICGDAGYGKTEVALRAIYKAVLSGKQVAFLCPTTILAEQHYKTCKSRLSGFMVKVARLNRLVPKKENKTILNELANGDINLVCGTHKLLNKKVEFKNLGLLILDEEQRFGVEDKEKIKNLKTDIDVLTLSATPIPRTLHMSLSGIRDISIIETPPRERMPVQTFVSEFSESLLINACKQELARGGQILILYNRIEHIYKFENIVKNLLPNVKIGVAHGRLNQKQLEDAILKLYNREYQILIATTLIENGIDLPNANTLIVIDADRLGLSQLYQLRGRVGRSNKLAYAYFTYDKNKILTEKAYQRLDAIMEFTQMGSGLKIAMRDLDIRGVGNVLGKEQHGSMEKVGYHLYCKLLEDAVKELKGLKIEIKKEIRLDINLNAFISENYIQSEADRIKKYTEISELGNMQELDSLKVETEKTYGCLPIELENLMLIALLKNLAVNNDIQRVLITDKASRLYFYKSEQILPEQIAKKLKDKRQTLIIEKQPIISFENSNKSIKEKLLEAINFLTIKNKEQTD